MAESSADAQDLVRRAARGDRGAFDALWRDHNPQLRRYLASLGLRDVDDVAAQAWLEALDRLETSDERPDAFRRLLFTVGRRRMIDELRRSGRRQTQSLDDAYDVSDPDEATEAFDDTQRAIDLLTALPPAQSEVVALRVIGGFSAEEVGELTGRSAGAVRVMAHRALRALEEMLTPTGDEDGIGSFEPLARIE